MEKKEVIRQIRGVMKNTKKQISETNDLEEKAAAFAACEAYMQVFYFCGMITREEYRENSEEMDHFRKGTERMRDDTRELSKKQDKNCGQAASF